MAGTTVTINGLEIAFPYEPYSIQVDYMTKVLECLNRGCHGVLESPTGTGKTLALLCATIAWQRSLKKNLDPREPTPTPNNLGDRVPKIIYASRTHSQLTKAMKELRSISKYSGVKICVLGSRDQLCIHPQVVKEKSLSAKNHLCRMYVKTNGCAYNNRVNSARSDIAFNIGVNDIEDLVVKCKRLSCCPYYMAKDLQETSEIIFLPYNYLLDPQIRKSLNFVLPFSVIILDEAHNVDKICEESASVSIYGTDITSTLLDITAEMENMYKESNSNNDFQMEFVDRNYTPEDLCNIKERFQKLDKLLTDVDVGKNGNTYNGRYMFNFLQQAEISPENVSEFIGKLRQVSEVLAATGANSYDKKGFALQQMADKLDTIFSILGPDKDASVADSYFKVHFEQESSENQSRSFLHTPTKKLNFWCFSANFGVTRLVKSGVHCIIFTSGTLSPLEAVINELGLKNPVTLENPHIVSKFQVHISVLTKGPTNVELNSSYNNRSNVKYWNELGLTLQNYSRIIPDGLLVFFPSYVTLKKAVAEWQNSGLWRKIMEIKPIFSEPQNKYELSEIMEEYYQAVDSGGGKGAILLGVCRGKVSEGLDFSDRYGRGVLITGIPFPPLFDPKIKLKKEFVSSGLVIKNMSGEAWYSCEATKAVNQAIGRVIRHAEDYGVILLCDAKFKNNSIVNHLSKWLLPLINYPKSFGVSIGMISSFFHQNKVMKLPSSGTSCTNQENKPKITTKVEEIITLDDVINKANSSSGPDKSGLFFGPSTSNGNGAVLCQNSNELRAEYTLNDIPKCLITPVTSKTEIEVQPAKKRKIKLIALKFLESSEDPRNEIKKFLMEVKTTLDAESYSTFAAILSKYNITHDFKEALKMLVTLLPCSDPVMKELFKGCRRFFIGSHQTSFDNYCIKFTI